MIPPDHYAARRRELLDRLERPLLLFAGGAIPRNFPANPYPERADSHFLFFFPHPEADAAALFDPDDGTVTLFLPARTIDEALWAGPRPSFEDVRRGTGVDAVLGRDALEEEVRRRGRPVDGVAVADPRTSAVARRLTGADLDFADPDRIAPPDVQRILADLRNRKRGPEIAEMRRAAAVTAAAFAEAMAATRPGATEQELLGVLEGGFTRRGGVPGFSSILTVRGEVLHNHHHGNTLREGDLVLVDAGAEVDSGYGADVTRTWPAGGKFTSRQRDVYAIVQAAQATAMAAVRPGVRFRHVHDAACAEVARGLKDLGILRGSVQELVDTGAHALFFPHGVGHLLGLDAHDLETFGDRILYGPGRSRSARFGTAYLRIDLDLEPGMVVTIEPGVYFVPAILHLPELRTEFRDTVDFDRAESYLADNDGRGFGGVRIEDDLLVTDGGHEILTADLPREIADVEARVGASAA